MSVPGKFAFFLCRNLATMDCCFLGNVFEVTGFFLFSSIIKNELVVRC